MNAEGGGGVGDAFLISVVGFLDVELFEFFQSLVEQDLTIQHVVNYCFEAGAYLHLSLVLSGYEGKILSRVIAFGFGKSMSPFRAQLNPFLLLPGRLPLLHSRFQRHEQ